MLRIVDPLVKFLYSVLLSACAIIALVLAPPMGIILLIALQRFLKREAELHARPKPHIKLA